MSESPDIFFYKAPLSADKLDHYFGSAGVKVHGERFGLYIKEGDHYHLKAVFNLKDRGSILWAMRLLVNHVQDNGN